MIPTMKSSCRQVATASLAAFIMALVMAPAQVVTDGRRTVRLESQTATLVIDLGGGSIVDFHLAGGGLNPLHWLGPGDEDKAFRPMAHFLCLDRWGPPSDAELRNGMPFHGEASRVEWQQLDARERQAGRIVVAMEATLPLAGLEVRRTVELSESASFFSVSETVTNRNKLGRVYNMVQHATIGPPFLDETTVVDSNAQQGFMQSSPLPNPEQPQSVSKKPKTKIWTNVSWRVMNRSGETSTLSYRFDRGAMDPHRAADSGCEAGWSARQISAA